MTGIGVRGGQLVEALRCNLSLT